MRNTYSVVVVWAFLSWFLPSATIAEGSPPGLERVESLLAAPAAQGQWQRLLDGVWQRRNPDDTVEHYATGSEGVRWALDGMRRRAQEMEDRAARGDGPSWQQVEEYRGFLAAIEKALAERSRNGGGRDDAGDAAASSSPISRTPPRAPVPSTRVTRRVPAPSGRVTAVSAVSAPMPTPRRADPIRRRLARRFIRKPSTATSTPAAARAPAGPAPPVATPTAKPGSSPASGSRSSRGSIPIATTARSRSPVPARVRSAAPALPVSRAPTGSNATGSAPIARSPAPATATSASPRPTAIAPAVRLSPNASATAASAWSSGRFLTPQRASVEREFPGRPIDRG